MGTHPAGSDSAVAEAGATRARRHSRRRDVPGLSFYLSLTRG